MGASIHWGPLEGNEGSFEEGSGFFWADIRQLRVDLIKGDRLIDCFYKLGSPVLMALNEGSCFRGSILGAPDVWKLPILRVESSEPLLGNKRHSAKQAWNLKGDPLQSIVLCKGLLFRFHVSLGDCI